MICEACNKIMKFNGYALNEKFAGFKLVSIEDIIFCLTSLFVIVTCVVWWSIPLQILVRIVKSNTASKIGEFIEKDRYKCKKAEENDKNDETT